MLSSGEIASLIFLILLIYPFLLYPAILKFINYFISTPYKKNPDFQPVINILISAYNEENLIEDCIRSVFNSGYPVEKLKVFVGSDGSSDSTFKILQKLSAEFSNISAFDLPRSGKNQVLNFLAEKTDADFLVYLDADCRIQKNHLNILISHFADEKTGCVIASMEQIDDSGNDNTGRAGEGFYQKFEKYLRLSESRISGTVNSLGALYAIRKTNYRKLPSDFVCDDYMPILDTCLNKQRVIFDDEIVAIEVRTKSLNDEFSRRVRVGAGGLESIWERRKLLLPNYGFTSFFLWSHKIVRWLSPVFMFSLLLTTVFIQEQTLLKNILLVGQTIFYISALAGWLFEKLKIKISFFRFVLFYYLMNIGFLIALLRFFGKKQSSMWDRNGNTVE